MLFAYALKNAVIMTLIVCIAHLLMLGALACPEEPPPPKQMDVQRSVAKREEEELLRFVMEDDVVPFVTGSPATPLDICNNRADNTIQPYTVGHAFASHCSAVDFRA